MFPSCFSDALLSVGRSCISLFLPVTMAAQWPACLLLLAWLSAALGWQEDLTPRRYVPLGEYQQLYPPLTALTRGPQLGRTGRTQLAKWRNRTECAPLVCHWEFHEWVFLSPLLTQMRSSTVACRSVRLRSAFQVNFLVLVFACHLSLVMGLHNGCVRPSLAPAHRIGK